MKPQDIEVQIQPIRTPKGERLKWSIEVRKDDLQSLFDFARLCMCFIYRTTSNHGTRVHRLKISIPARFVEPATGQVTRKDHTYFDDGYGFKDIFD